jgi:hypothetical protein
MKCAEENHFSILVRQQEKCRADSCGPMPSINNAICNGTSSRNGSVLACRCSTGYTVSPRSASDVIILTCDGKSWKLSNSAQCTAINCPPLHSSTSTNTSSTTVGTRVLVTCSKGQGFKKSSKSLTSTCSLTGNWNPPVTQCVPISCPLLAPQIVNTSSTDIGTVAYVTCPDGQTFSGLNVQTATMSSSNTQTSAIMSVCGNLGQWIPSVPSCILISHRTTFPAMEAPSSAYIGSTAIIFVSIAFILVAISDVSHGWKTFVRCCRRIAAERFHTTSRPYPFLKKRFIVFLPKKPRTFK